MARGPHADKLRGIECFTQPLFGATLAS